MTLSKLTAEWITANESNVGGFENPMDREEQTSHLECDKEISKLRAQLIRWRTAFKHIHINNGIDDSCKTCGLDLRDDIHLRIGERFPLAS